MTAYFLIMPFDHHCRSSFCSIKGDQSPKPPVKTSAIGYQKTTTTIKNLKSWSRCVYLYLESFDPATCRKKGGFWCNYKCKAPSKGLCSRESQKSCEEYMNKAVCLQRLFLPCMMNKACLYWSWTRTAFTGAKTLFGQCRNPICFLKLCIHSILAICFQW